MDEFELIAKYLRPLARAPGALSLLDDAALIEVPPGQELVVTKDAIVSAVHFLSPDPLDRVARKLVRVNISDLAAKGAKPLGYFLACCWPRGTREADIGAFAKGLAEDQSAYGWSLLGGDTTPTDGPLTLSLTALGTVAKGTMVRRSGARAGDALFVTGTIGDAGLGLRIALDEALGISDGHATQLLSRYHLPEPRLTFALAAARFMHAAIDVSDGLIADAGHVAKASGIGIRIHVERVPLSPGARAFVAQGGALEALLIAGDDYEICFAAPPGAEAAITDAAAATRTQVTRVGDVVPGVGVMLIGGDGRELPLPAPGERTWAFKAM